MLQIDSVESSTRYVQVASPHPSSRAAPTVPASRFDLLVPRDCRQSRYASASSELPTCGASHRHDRPSDPTPLRWLITNEMLQGYIARTTSSRRARAIKHEIMPPYRTKRHRMIFADRGYHGSRVPVTQFQSLHMCSLAIRREADYERTC